MDLDFVSVETGANRHQIHLDAKDCFGNDRFRIVITMYTGQNEELKTVGVSGHLCVVDKINKQTKPKLFTVPKSKHSLDPPSFVLYCMEYSEVVIEKFNSLRLKSYNKDGE